MKRKALVIINPNSGLKKANRYLTDLVAMFNAADICCTVFTTTKRRNAERIVEDNSSQCDIIICIGGDGTFNEVLSGVIGSGSHIPIGYIPSGSTNDFANGLGISKNVITAARNIIKGKAIQLDAGLFGDRVFSYVASCGAFSDTSYSTSTDLKNAFGHTAYVLEGIKSLPSIKPVHLKIECGGKMWEDDYIFVAVCNSTSIGGVLKLDKELVDMNDGMFEVLLIKSPESMGELTKTLHYINTKNYNNDMIEMIKTTRLRIYSEKPVDWSLDGEPAIGRVNTEISIIKSAYSLIVNKGVE